MHARALLAAALGVVSAAALPSNHTFAKRAVTTIENCEVSGQIALTFDDGPYIWETDVRNALGDSKGTFFLNGNNYDCIYDRADDIIAAHNAGWTIGSHGWSHAHMGELTWDQVHNELWLVEQALTKIIGVKPIYFRPPYGETSDTLYAALENRGYTKVFLWSDDAGDANGDPPSSSEAMYLGIAQSYPAPHLVLNHETIETTHTEVLPYAVPLLKNAGYQLVAVDTCLGSDGEWPYTWVGEPGVRDSTWVCEPPLIN